MYQWCIKINDAYKLNRTINTFVLPTHPPPSAHATLWDDFARAALVLNERCVPNVRSRSAATTVMEWNDQACYCGLRTVVDP